jgi:hypothetical protein
VRLFVECAGPALLHRGVSQHLVSTGLDEMLDDLPPQIQNPINTEVEVDGIKLTKLSEELLKAFS